VFSVRYEQKSTLFLELLSSVHVKYTQLQPSQQLTFACPCIVSITVNDYQQDATILA